MLLLVIESELDQGGGIRIALIDEIVHRIVDVGAVARYVVDTRA